MESSLVEHPHHYNCHPSNVECIVIAKHHNFCVGNAIKYIWRAGIKEGNGYEQDIQKAIFYLKCELERLEEDKRIKETEIKTCGELSCSKMI